MEDARSEVRWSPRVTQWKLRNLYERTSAGIWDEDLINDVGMTLYMRCRDILSIHQAETSGKVTCPRCDAAGRTTLILRRGDRWTPMTCPECGWSLTWVEYHATFHRRQLNPGGAVTSFRTFVAAFERSRDPRGRMLAIDRVIHEFHYSLRELPDQPTRAAGVNLIAGNLTQVEAFLSNLSGMDLPEAFHETDRTWRAKRATIRWDDILEKKRNLRAAAGRPRPSPPPEG